MDPPFVVQALSHTSSSSSSLTHLMRRLHRLIRKNKYSYAAVYELIYDPKALNQQVSGSAVEAKSVLALLSVMSADTTQRIMLNSAGRQATPEAGITHKRPPESIARNEQHRHSVWETSVPKTTWISSHGSVVDELVPMDIATSQEGLHSPFLATYLVHLDILAEENSHHILHALGQSLFSTMEGWLSESLFTIWPNSLTPLESTLSPYKPVHYICIQAFSYRTCVEQITSYLQTFKLQLDRTAYHGSSYKMGMYKLFGSAC